MRKTGPYIGICDFTSPEEVIEMYGALYVAGGQEIGRLLMAGVMMSYKSMNGLPTKWANVFPRKDRVADIFSISNPWVLNTLHYADYEGVQVEWSLETATEWGGPNMDALQLDMIWPDALALRNYRRWHPNVRVILQVGANALDQVDNDPVKMLRRLWHYVGTIDDVLLDKSMGRGLGLDAAFLRPFVSAIHKERSDLKIAVAGGLGPDTLHLVAPLAKEFDELSIDAQSQLRASADAMKPIDWPRARAYVERAVDLFRQTH